MKFKQYGLLATLIFCLLTTTGCFALLLGAAAGAGGFAYVKGNLERNFDYPVDEVHQASLAALRKLDIIILDDDVTPHEAKVKGEFYDGEKLQIDIKALTEFSSKLKVRVGIFGDEDTSRLIANTIEEKL